MIQRIALAFLFFSFLITFLACSNEENKPETEESEQIKLPSDGIEITDAWARPGREGGNSAIYMKILNGSSKADTLISLSSPAAAMAEVHESYEQEEGMMGMRPVETVVVSPQDVLSLEPGGFHVMLMQLTQTFAEGDSVEFTVEFATAGEKSLTAPVQLVNR